MADTKFTAGPWEAEPSHASMDPVICMVAGLVISCKDTDYNKKANAHLIAAAPELYESLEDVLGLITPEFEQSPMVSFAKAALAKARGEAV